MLGRLIRRFGVAGALATLLTGSVAIAQVDNFLEDDTGTEVDQEESDATESEDTNESNLDLTILFKKVSELESENRFLNGRIEQLENELETLRRENRNRYSRPRRTHPRIDRSS